MRCVAHTYVSSIVTYSITSRVAVPVVGQHFSFSCWLRLIFSVYSKIGKHEIAIGGAHQQTSERAAPPVSVEEKGKAIGDRRQMLLILLMSIQY
jgi:hypothetical protein